MNNLTIDGAIGFQKISIFFEKSWFMIFGTVIIFFIFLIYICFRDKDKHSQNAKEKKE